MSDADFVRQMRRMSSIAAREKALYWRRYKLEHGPAAGIRIADELRRQVLAERPGWPGPDERAEDRVAHEQILDVLARTARRTG
jgi:hypothetical protein